MHLCSSRHVLVVCVFSACLSALPAVAGAQSAGPPPPVPAAVLNAFHQTYPGATITAASTQRDNGRATFRVEAAVKGRRHVVLYDARGSIIEIAEEVADTDLPGPVTAAWRSHPRASYVSGMKVSRGKAVRYELTLRGTRKTALVVQPDGTVVSFK